MVRFAASLLVLLIASTAFAATPHDVITNDDNGGPNTVSLYTVTGSTSSPKLTLKKTISTGGMAIGGGYFAGLTSSWFAMGRTIAHSSRMAAPAILRGSSFRHSR